MTADSEITAQCLTHTEIFVKFVHLIFETCEQTDIQTYI